MKMKSVFNWLKWLWPFVLRSTLDKSNRYHYHRRTEETHYHAQAEEAQRAESDRQQDRFAKFLNHFWHGKSTMREDGLDGRVLSLRVDVSPQILDTMPIGDQTAARYLVRELVRDIEKELIRANFGIDGLDVEIGGFNGRPLNKPERIADYGL